MKNEEAFNDFVKALKVIGLEKKLFEMTKDEVEGLIYIAQDCENIINGKDNEEINRLEQSYFKLCGRKIPRSTEIPF